MINYDILKSEERATLALRSLYKQYGYLPFKMSKFEEYDLYVRNKEFLVSENVITFNDTDGRLLALKPDVTLSIIKNCSDECTDKQKVYYNENVYRVSGSTHLFKEIVQSGIECIGNIDILDVYEALFLAAKSLATISDNFVLDISHMGIISAVLDNASDNDTFKREALKFIAAKNSHDIEKLCDEYCVTDSAKEILLSIIDSHGAPSVVLNKISMLKDLDGGVEAYAELSKLCSMLSATEYYDKINLDFSVVNNMSYYNGIVFKGFLSGICEGVLSGGEYDVLMKRMGRAQKAIGFALYLDLLESLDVSEQPYDVDALLVYDAKIAAETVILKKEELVAAGKCVLATTCIPEKLRYRELINLTDGGVK